MIKVQQSVTISTPSAKHKLMVNKDYMQRQGDIEAYVDDLNLDTQQQVVISSQAIRGGSPLYVQRQVASIDASISQQVMSPSNRSNSQSNLSINGGGAGKAVPTRQPNQSSMKPGKTRVSNTIPSQTPPQPLLVSVAQTVQTSTITVPNETVARTSPINLKQKAPILRDMFADEEANNSRVIVEGLKNSPSKNGRGIIKDIQVLEVGEPLLQSGPDIGERKNQAMQVPTDDQSIVKLAVPEAQSIIALNDSTQLALSPSSKPGSPSGGESQSRRAKIKGNAAIKITTPKRGLVINELSPHKVQESNAIQIEGIPKSQIRPQTAQEEQKYERPANNVESQDSELVYKTIPTQMLITEGVPSISPKKEKQLNSLIEEKVEGTPETVINVTPGKFQGIPNHVSFADLTQSAEKQADSPLSPKLVTPKKKNSILMEAEVAPIITHVTQSNEKKVPAFTGFGTLFNQLGAVKKESQEFNSGDIRSSVLSTDSDPVAQIQKNISTESFFTLSNAFKRKILSMQKMTEEEIMNLQKQKQLDLLKQAIPPYKWSSAHTLEGSNCGFTKINQDGYVIIEDYIRNPENEVVSLHLIADGHGPMGHLVTNFIIEVFPVMLKTMLVQAYEKNYPGAGQMIMDNMRRTYKPGHVQQSVHHTVAAAKTLFLGDRWEVTKKRQALMKQCLTQAFEEIHEQVANNEDFEARSSGSTLTVVLIEGDYLYSANVGDSKAILLWDFKKKVAQKKNDNSQSVNITVLTASHSPDEAKEKTRILKSNGQVRPSKNSSQGDTGVMRVYFKGKEGPGLAVSRSIGDTDAHIIGVLSKPDITVVKLDHKMIIYTLIVASDGLWSVYGPQAVLKNMNLVQFGDSDRDKGDERQQEGEEGKIMIKTRKANKIDKMDAFKLREVNIALCQITRKRWDEIFELRAAKVLASKAEMNQRLGTALATIASKQGQGVSNSIGLAGATALLGSMFGGGANRPKGSIDDITILLADLNLETQ